MKTTAIEVLQNHHYPVSMGSTEDRINLIEAMKDYAKGVIDHLLQNAGDYIYVIDEPDEPTEAVFSYDAMDQLRRQLK